MRHNFPRFQGEKERKNDAFFSFFFVWSDHEARKKARKRRERENDNEMFVSNRDNELVRRE